MYLLPALHLTKDRAHVITPLLNIHPYTRAQYNVTSKLNRTLRLTQVFDCVFNTCPMTRMSL